MKPWGAWDARAGDRKMPKHMPWHSAKEPVYHNNTECEEGNKIEPAHRLQGTEGKPLCKECESLNTEGK